MKMIEGAQPWHAHIYYGADERAAAADLQMALRTNPDLSFVGRLVDRPIGPHPIPQFEVHFRGDRLAAVEATLRASGLRVLIHPLTDDDLADHTTLSRWIGEPLALDLKVLDPPGHNQGVARFGKSDF
jgi:DOPA 4,5-dioxygenase